MYELAACAVPSIAICYSRKQRKMAQQFALRGAVINAGLFDTLTKNRFLPIIHTLLTEKKLRNVMAHNARTYIDGKGSMRIAHIVANL